MNMEKTRLDRQLNNQKSEMDYVLKSETENMLNQVIEITYDNDAINEAKLAWLSFSNEEEFKADKAELLKNYQDLKNNQVDNLTDLKELTESYISMVINKKLLEYSSEYCIKMKKAVMANLEDTEKAKKEIRALEKYLKELEQYAKEMKQRAIKIINAAVDAAIENLK